MNKSPENLFRHNAPHTRYSDARYNGVKQSYNMRDSKIKHRQEPCDETEQLESTSVESPSEDILEEEIIIDDDSNTSNTEGYDDMTTDLENRYG